ncbi:MFS transporter [Nocardia sp. NBC_01377]|uniref:MFS transporter n=1 Tax=Nocardia sp. NBC_01377 TaxID=2903595 RepID=UPI0032559535
MTNSTTTTPDPSATLSHRQIMTILSGLLLGIFLAALDQNIVSVAIVQIANSLHGFDEQAWATTAYLITATITTPLYGKLADIYGRKPFYLLAIGLFVLGSVACTFATSMHQLAAFRAFQGLGAGGLMSLAFTIIGDIVPARERVRYQGYFMIVFGSATVLGPVLGGFFSHYAELGGLEGWRWVFLVNVPVGVIAFLVVAKVLNVPHRRQRHRIDWFGALTLTLCAAPLLLVAEQGRQWGWNSDRALLCYGIGAAGLALFVFVELVMKDAALIPLRLFRSGTFSVATVGGFIVGIAMFGAIALVPLYFQVVRGYAPTTAGLLMLPLVSGIMVGSQIAGTITKRSGRYKMLPVTGSFMIALGAALHAGVDYHSPLWQPLACGAVIGFGLGCCMQTLIIAAQNAVSPSDMGVSTATATFFRQIGGTLGVAVFLTILFNLLPHRILDAFGGRLPDGFDAAQLATVQSSTNGIAALPEELRVPILTGFTESMQSVFLVAAGVAVLAGAVLLFMKEIPLQSIAAALVDPVAEDARKTVERGHTDRRIRADGPMRKEPAVKMMAKPERVGAGATCRNGGTGSLGTTSVDLMTEIRASERCAISGRVHREDGHPVAAVALTLIDQCGRQCARTTGADDGSYTVLAPAPGEYVLIAATTGHQPAAVGVTVGGRKQRLDVPLLGSGEVSGEVRSARKGTPISGATITLTDTGGEVVGAAVSTGDGEYLCRGVVPGTYTLVAIADHMRPCAATLTVPDSGLLRHDVDLAPMAVLAGSAMADDDRAVADIQITVLDAAGDMTASARTDEHGRYVVPDLPEGQYTVVARGYPPVTSRVTVAGGEVAHDVRLGYRPISGQLSR